MCAAMGLAPPRRFHSCASLVSPGLQPTFISWQRRSRPTLPIRGLALDYRGHAQSAYDRNSDNYTLAVARADLLAVLTALEIAPAIFLGTSYGGLLTMMLAVWRPTAIAGVILNDIGPVVELRGLLRIKHSVGKLPVLRTLEEGAEMLRW
jgi:pimeloyl-ACP methyl ester carboxylesterase